MCVLEELLVWTVSWEVYNNITCLKGFLSWVTLSLSRFLGVLLVISASASLSFSENLSWLLDITDPESPVLAQIGFLTLMRRLLLCSSCRGTISSIFSPFFPKFCLGLWIGLLSTWRWISGVGAWEKHIVGENSPVSWKKLEDEN